LNECQGRLDRSTRFLRVRPLEAERVRSIRALSVHRAIGGARFIPALSRADVAAVEPVRLERPSQRTKTYPRRQPRTKRTPFRVSHRRGSGCRIVVSVCRRRRRQWTSGGDVRC